MQRRRELMTFEHGHWATATGGIVTFNTPFAKPLRSLKAKFTPVQEGTGDPSPDNVRPITGWTGLTAYKTGKNLFNKNGMTRRDGYNYNYSGVEESISTTGYFLEYISVKPNTYYTISGIGRSAIYEYTGAKAWIRRGAATNGAWSFKTSDITHYIRIQYRIEDLDVNTAQLELGSTATAYSPYSGTTIPITFPAVGKNLFDEVYPNIDFGTVKYKALYVGDGTFTASTNMPKGAYDNLFFLPGKVSTGASTATNEIDSNTSRTITSENGYVTIGYRKDASYDLNPTDYHVQIEKGSTATAYEPYTNTVYGGTLDVTSGELVVNTVAVPITPDTISNRSEKGYACVVVGTVGYVNADVPQICNVLPKTASASSVKNGAFIVYNSSAYNRAHIAFCFSGCYGAGAAETRSLNIAKVTELIESGTTPTVVFGISEPQTYHLTPVEVKTLIGTNNIWSTANGNVTAEYWTR